jgi:hypothetical protein
MLLRNIVICPGCAETFSLSAIEERPRGDCPACGFANNLMPNRLLTVPEMLESRVTLDGVNLGAFMRAYRSVLARGAS